ncbi:DUF523 domain-containing protein [Clostridium bornimense]|uniref:DUF523 domain-containing protein n=1 Tax=Clostridium bornimense TaxID=1216932 RepID=UPI001C125145|nr:DUF523 domain-containing protein [Clostridium bornimense]MBU5316936.1 DUF523 domain-containing protein [Clostridium bornimense]
MKLVSMCLCGVNCKYSGGNNYDETVLKIVNEGDAIPVCPEIMGGLGTPRIPHEIVGGDGFDVLEGRAKVISKDGDDNTVAFIAGAEKVLEIAKKLNVKEVIFKSKSPSCGNGKIYDGSFSGTLIDGVGVTTALMIKNGIRVSSI